MINKKKLKNYAKGNDERTVEMTGRAASITLIIGVGIFLTEILVKFMITKDLSKVTWEAVLLLVMIVIFVIIHLLNKIPMKNKNL